LQGECQRFESAILHIYGGVAQLAERKAYTFRIRQITVRLGVRVPPPLYKQTHEVIMGYETLTEFERALARFGDKVELIVGLEVGGKMNADEAYKEIKDMMKELKKLRKQHIKSGKDLDNFEL
jgi:hypothetical protein